jgi:phage FluMu protein Com
MSFAKCSSCQQEYSGKSLIGDKCPACSNLNGSTDQELTLAVQNFDSSQRKTAKWLVGRNALNSVVVAKGVFSSTLYVVENGKVTYQRSISFLDKLRGH